MPIFHVKSVKIYTGQKKLHEYIRGVCDKYEVWAHHIWGFVFVFVFVFFFQFALSLSLRGQDIQMHEAGSFAGGFVPQGYNRK